MFLCVSMTKVPKKEEEDKENIPPNNGNVGIGLAAGPLSGIRWGVDHRTDYEENQPPSPIISFPDDPMPSALPHPTIPDDPASVAMKLHYLQKQMPSDPTCAWSWTTTLGLRIKRLFEAVRHIVLEARLVITPKEIRLVSQKDTDGEIEVGFVLDVINLETHGKFFLHKDHQNLMIPLNMEEWANAVRTIRADDVVGICVPMHSLQVKAPTIDLYIKKPGRSGHCFQYHCRWLKQGEYMHFGLPNLPILRGLHEGQITLEAVEFKRLLTSLTACALRLDFGPTWTDFVAQADGEGQTSMKMRVMALVPPCFGCVEHQPNQLAHMGPGGCLHNFLGDPVDDKDDDSGDLPVKSDTYSVINLLRVTKATKLSGHVTLLYSNNSPLLLQYDMDGWGRLEYQVYSEPPAETLKMW